MKSPLAISSQPRVRHDARVRHDSRSFPRTDYQFQVQAEDVATAREERVRATQAVATEAHAEARQIELDAIAFINAPLPDLPRHPNYGRAFSPQPNLQNEPNSPVTPAATRRFGVCETDHRPLSICL